jgi:DNA repair exonuclease SbcCD ATPase subunit
LNFTSINLSNDKECNTVIFKSGAFFKLQIHNDKRRKLIVGQRKLLWILLLFFAVAGVFSGFAIWQISQAQQKERDLARAKVELEQTTQQMQILKEQNTASITARGKLLKDLTEAKKQLKTMQQQGLTLEQQLKVEQTQKSALASENSTLKIKLSVAEKQLESLQQSFGVGSGRAKPLPKPATTPNFLLKP